jgi:DNA-nicking Smr family endonuclease
MKELDLHGMTHEDAIISSENFLIQESFKQVFECRLITGNSMKLQIKIINEVLKPHGFSWYIPTWNTGEIIVSE